MKPMKIVALMVKGGQKGAREARRSLNVSPEGGIEGDAPSGGMRQISLFNPTDAQAAARQQPQGLCARRFFANVLIEGLEQCRPKPGDRLRFHDAVVRVTQCGKDCFPDDCALPGLGLPCPLQRCLFGAIEQGGTLNLEDAVVFEPSPEPGD